MSEKFLKKQGQKQENAQAGQKLRENDRLTDEELEQIVGGGVVTLPHSDGSIFEYEVPDAVRTPLTHPDAANGSPDKW